MRLVTELSGLLNNNEEIMKSIIGMIKRLNRIAVVSDGAETYEVYRDRGVVYVVAVSRHPLLFIFMVDPSVGNEEVINAVAKYLVEKGMLDYNPLII